MDNKGLKLFISYSHKDSDPIEVFKKHLSPLKQKQIIYEWYDRKILAGNDFQLEINSNLNDADIICLMISVDFLNSSSCIYEKQEAFKLKAFKNIPVIPVILGHCSWQEFEDLKKYLALPLDGKPVSEFQDEHKVFVDLVSELKKIAEKECLLNNLKNSEEITKFLTSTELLEKMHSRKSEVVLDDIFVYPDLKEFNNIKEFHSKISAEDLINNFESYEKVMISGDSQSGKTTLCKKIYTEMRKKKLIPIYIASSGDGYEGLIANRIEKNFIKQYGDDIQFNDVPKDRVVPIVDDFHQAKKKEKHIKDLEEYQKTILIVDDIFNLNLKDEETTKDFNQFMIKEFNATLRNLLIEKWILLDENSFVNDHNQKYRLIDSTTELVNSSLGKVFSSGIMPSYPFFILSIMSTNEAMERPLNQEITSQGYCYQALIYMHLRKQGVNNEYVDTYINFLIELSYFFFSNRKKEISENELMEFVGVYKEKFNLTIKENIILNDLVETKIIKRDSFLNYSFQYKYLYYFFVAKYLSDHIDGLQAHISEIINNLHTNENAYIAIFIAHHNKSIDFLDEIMTNAICLFDKYEPSSLETKELLFFDNEINELVKAAFPAKEIAHQANRKKDLEKQDRREDSESNAEDESVEGESGLLLDLRRSIKTVEVMGSIIKNRSGSLEKKKLEEIFEHAINVHLRILTSFFELIKEKEQQKSMIQFFHGRLEFIMKKNSEEMSRSELEEIAKKIFWGLNFSVVYGIIRKIILSVGSERLQSVVDEVCGKNKTPAHFLIQQGIRMWYSKNIQVDHLSQKIKEEEFSYTAERILKFLVVNHCSMHKVDYKDRQKIESKLNIPTQKFISNK